MYAKPPFGAPEAVSSYLSRCTHRVAIFNHRLVHDDADTVAFRWKDYRIQRGDRMQVMPLPKAEFIRRFLIHVLPSGFHRIRHTGFLTNGLRRDGIAEIWRLRDTEPQPNRTSDETGNTKPDDPNKLQPCPKCGGTMIVKETFLRGQSPKSHTPPCEDAA